MRLYTYPNAVFKNDLKIITLCLDSSQFYKKVHKTLREQTDLSYKLRNAVIRRLNLLIYDLNTKRLPGPPPLKGRLDDDILEMDIIKELKKEQELFESIQFCLKTTQSCYRSHKKSKTANWYKHMKRVENYLKK